MKTLLISLLGAPALLSLPAFAQENPSQEPPPYDRFVLRLGGNYVFNAKAEISANRRDGLLGTTINSEKDLDLEEAKWAGRAELDWRFAPNHTLELGYYSFKLEGSKSLTRDVIFGEQTFTIGGTVDSELELGLSRLEYIYSFYRNEKVDLGVGFGAYGVSTKISLATVDRAIEESKDVSAPLPVIGFRMDYKSTPKLDTIVAYDLFFINQGDFSGSMNDFRLLLEHRTFKHVGFGVGFDHFALNMSGSNDEWDGRAAADWNGALVYLTLKY